MKIGHRVVQDQNSKYRMMFCWVDESGKFIRDLTNEDVTEIKAEIKEHSDEIYDRMATGRSVGEYCFLENKEGN